MKSLIKWNGPVYTAQLLCLMFIGLFKVITWVDFQFQSFLVITVYYKIINQENSKWNVWEKSFVGANLKYFLCKDFIKIFLRIKICNFVSIWVLATDRDKFFSVDEPIQFTIAEMLIFINSKYQRNNFSCFILVFFPFVIITSYEDWKLIKNYWKIVFFLQNNILLTCNIKTLCIVRNCI